MLTSRKSQWLSSVMVLATVLVVMCHADDVIRMEDRGWIVRWLGGAFTASNTPNFFFLSGMLLGMHCGEDGWWGRAVIKRMRTLLIPYVLWNLVCFGLDLALSFAKSVANGTSCGALDLARHRFCWGIPAALGLSPFGCPYLFPLWYIKCLFLFVLISWPLFWIVERFKKGSLIFIVLILGLFSWAAYYDVSCVLSVRRTFDLQGLGFFLLGGWLMIHFPGEEWTPTRVFAMLSFSAWCVTSALVVGLPEHVAEALRPLYVAIAMFALNAIVRAFDIRMPKALVVNAFFIYVCHWYIFSKLSMAFQFAGLTGYCGLVMCGVGVPVVIGMMMK